MRDDKLFAMMIRRGNVLLYEETPRKQFTIIQ